ncbi:MAG: molybdopterin molybdotransferase MoeA [Hyphomicrobium sp.]|nr:molybdopterin molybdotransferase MoeA [Hyphomicrobium sp.]
MTRKPPAAVDDCFAHPSKLMRHNEALAILATRIVPSAGVSSVPLRAAAGRIVAAPVSAPHPIPLHTNAAVDGYAFAHADAMADPTIVRPVVGRAAAGHPYRGDVPKGAVVRILTGAVMPAGTDTVAMQEDTERLNGAVAMVRLPEGLKRGTNVRKAGEDVAEGARMFDVGDRLRPQDLAALASIGVDEVSCFDRLRIGIVSTGDEVRRPGSGPLAIGEVFDANAPMLAALAQRHSTDIIDYGILPDDPDVIERALLRAADECEVLLTTGGASRGEEDHIAAILDRIGTRHFWQIAVKPGRPMMFGQIGNEIDRTIIVGLPGNPVAVFVCFLLYVDPILHRLGGGRWREPKRYPLPAAFEVPKRKTGRREFWRGTRIETPEGPMVEKFARDGSGLISGLRIADGLIDIPEDVASVARGDPVAFIPFAEFGIID